MDLKDIKNTYNYKKKITNWMDRLKYQDNIKPKMDSILENGLIIKIL